MGTVYGMIDGVASLLVVHHTPSPALHSMLDAVREGATDRRIEDVTVELRPALTAGPVDVLGADGYLLGTPANLGYMAGALKHFFDQVYYPCLDATVGRPFGMYVHGNDDTDGAVAAIRKIATGLRWRLAYDPVTVVGPPDGDDLARLRDLGATLAAGLTI